MVENWKKLQSETLGDYHIFRLREDRLRSPHNEDVYSFYVLEAPDWIHVIPLTVEGKVVLIRQYRFGIEEVSLEIPGGMVDGEDVDPAEAARRELLEETGYGAQEIVPIGQMTPNPAFLNNRCYTFLALNSRKIAEPQLDTTESIEVTLADLTDIPGLIAAGTISHALVIAAFYHLEQYRRQQLEGLQ